MNSKNIFFVVFLLDVTLIYPSAFDQALHDAGKARVFEVMYKGPGGIAQINKPVLFAATENLALDLNLPEISKKFDCKTLMGQAFISFGLGKVISPKDTSNTIAHRQQLIQRLVENQPLQEEIAVLIEEAVEHEAVVMQCMKHRFVLGQQTDPFDFVSKFFRSTQAGNVYQQYSGVTTVISSLDRIKLQWYNLSKSYDESSAASSALLVGMTLKNLEKMGLGLYHVSSDEMSHAMQEFFTGINSEALANYFQKSFALSWNFWDIPTTAYTTIRSGYDLYKYYIEAFAVRDSLYSLQRLIVIAKKIEQLCAECNLENQFKVSSIRSPKGLSLLQNLNHSRYQEKKSYILYTMGVHTFLYQVYENDMLLAPVYASIAEMDAYLAIARKMTSLQNMNQAFCFVEFLDDTQPRIEAKGFWNVLVTKESVVTNDIDESKNIILTGSNEGGKTTAIRAILQNIVLSQTFGVAAASTCKLTPFDVIHSYLHIADDILQGRSRFAAEVKQAKDILGRAQYLRSDEKFFFTLDELFTGTNGEDGAEVAYNFINNVASMPNIQFIYATHFNKLKKIAEVNTSCANYQIEPPHRDAQGNFIRDAHGQLIYPYKLSKGANNVNVALERAKDAGIFITP